MLKKIITKNFAFVILLASLAAFSAACSFVFPDIGDNKNKARETTMTTYQNPQVVGTIKTGEITESSGIAASKCQENVLWTHNDSGDKAFIFAVNRQGEKLATYLVKNATNIDWEDIAEIKNAAGECVLYIADIGNNSRVRSGFKIYVVAEPRINAADKNSSKKNPSETAPAAAIKFDYPDTRHDAETLLVHPQTGDIYILSKRLSGAAGVYKLSKNYDADKINRLEKIADFQVPAVPNGFLTGGDISPDGRRVIICDYFDGYEIVLPDNAKNFDEIWKQNIETIRLGIREQGEAVGYSADGKSIFATSENKNSPLIEVRRK